MRWTIILAAMGLTGCALVSKQAMNAQVSARIASEKSAKIFATCSAEAMDRDLIDNDDGLSIFMREGAYIRARWDFVTTNTGSDAELRGPADYDAEIAKVRACANTSQ